VTLPRDLRLSGLFAVAFVMVALAGLPALTASTADQQSDPLSEPFKGVTTDGTVEPDLFSIRATGVSTAPVREAARRFLGGLTTAQRQATTFPADDLEWRRWNNVHRAAREGVSLREMTEAQRELAFGLMQASLSARGLEKSRNVMRLNGHLADLLDAWDEYGDDLYWFTVMGEPSATEPWGWQLDGHHLVINYFVLGDQVVMTPTFMGSEPVTATTGRYAGASVLQDEEALGLAFMQRLDREQQDRARGEEPKTRGNARAQAFRDNLVLDYQGLPGSELSAEQRAGLLRIITEFVGNMDDGHARVRMDEVEQHLDRTFFYWLGEAGPEAVFYYRIHSPVILIEFDHQGPVALEGDRQVPTRAHVHTVVRTPNGNDYGKDLLRQHYEAHQDDEAHGHLHEGAPGRR
jgi:predicted nuclease of restriction endonuclease-like (RecB) superfamily